MCGGVVGRVRADTLFLSWLLWSSSILTATRANTLYNTIITLIQLLFVMKVRTDGCGGCRTRMSSAVLLAVWVDYSITRPAAAPTVRGCPHSASVGDRKWDNNGRAALNGLRAWPLRVFVSASCCLLDWADTLQPAIGHFRLSIKFIWLLNNWIESQKIVSLKYWVWVCVCVCAVFLHEWLYKYACVFVCSVRDV